jgi:hypothetical protein
MYQQIEDPRTWYESRVDVHHRVPIPAAAKASGVDVEQYIVAIARLAAVAAAVISGGQRVCCDGAAII